MNERTVYFYLPKWCSHAFNRLSNRPETQTLLICLGTQKEQKKTRSLRILGWGAGGEVRWEWMWGWA